MGWVKERRGGRVLPISLPPLLYFGFWSIFLVAKTKNLILPLVVPWPFFARKPHANACYAGYTGDSSASLPKFSPRLLKRKRRNWWGKKVKVNSPHSIYRIYSINRPGRLLNFWTLRVGAYSRWALIRGWALIKFSPFSASEVCLFCNKAINANNKTRRSNKARFL